MQVNTSYKFTDSYTKQAPKNEDTSYEETLKSYTKKSTAPELRYKTIDEFFAKANKEGGILSFLQKENIEKIKELIEKKKEELKEKHGLNANPPLSKDALKDALQAYQEELDAFKKELMEKLKLKSIAEKNNAQTLSKLLT